MRSVSNITEDYSGRQKIYYPSSTDRIIEMTTKELIQKEIEFIPELYLEEILDFIVRV